MSKYFKSQPTETSPQGDETEFLLSTSGQLSPSRTGSPIVHIIRSSSLGSAAHDDDDDDLITVSNQEDHSIKAEILLVVSEPYVKHDNPDQSV